MDAFGIAGVLLLAFLAVLAWAMRVQRRAFERAMREMEPPPAPPPHPAVPHDAFAQALASAPTLFEQKRQEHAKLEQYRKGDPESFGSE